MLALAPAERVAKGPVGTRVGVRPQARRDIHSQHQPTIRRPRKRHPDQGTTQPCDIDPPLVQLAVQSSVTTTVFRHEREINQRPHRPVRAQQRVAQLEQRVAPRGQPRVQLRPEV
jgi:hypothetical protein